MKKNVFLFLALIVCVWLPINGNSQNFPSENHNSKNRNVIKLENNPQIVSAAEKIFPDGSIIFKQDKNITEKELIQKLKIDDLVTFSLQRETQSRFDQDAIFRRYQQLYKGIKIDGGGYTVKLLKNRSSRVPQLQMFSPNIYYNLHPNVEPSISKESLPRILGVKVVSQAELLISDLYSEEYKLLWKVFITKNDVEQIWLDAHTGHVIHRVIGEVDLTATTPTYGPQDLNDFVQGNTTFLRTPNGNLRIYEGFNPTNPVIPNEWNDNLIPQTNNTVDWGNVDATPGSLQSFFVGDLVIPEFQNMGVTFGNVRISSAGGGLAFFGSTTQNAYIEIGALFGAPTSLYDVIAHELGHCYLFQFLDYTNNNTNQSLHEGISDIIGVYIESFIQGADWVMGDDEVNLANGIDRDLAVQVCETNLQNAGRHERGLVIGHWFFAISTGIPADDIPAIGMQTAIDILVEALSNLNNPNAGFPEIREQTLLAAEINFGLCSPEYTAVANAWDRVCVTGQIEACPCDAYAQPSLTTQGMNVTCPTGVNLNLLHNGTTPQGATLIWSTDNDPSNGVVPHINPLVFSLGTYFAYYFNATENCYGPASQGVSITHPNSNDIHITTNTPYNSNMEIFGDIYIEDGITLTVTSTISFGPGASIYVGNNSKLIVDGGTLTACGQKWEGVVVEGQLTIGFTSQLPGQVELRNNAIIEKAVIGVNSTDKFTYAGFTFEFGGGIINVDNSVIQNCDIGLKFAPYGWGPIIGSGSPGEQSVIGRSTIKNCTTGIYSDGNIGLQIKNCTFENNNYADYEGFKSQIITEENLFTNLVLLYSDFPVLPGSSFESNNFINTYIETQAQGNFTPLNIENNSFLGSGFRAIGEVWFEIADNDFYDVEQGIGTEYTGDNTRNVIFNNAFYNNRFASSVWGTNDIEYLTNCFENTEFTDIEINDYASIYIRQGVPELSAGNCFAPSGRIETGSGTQSFTYWQKDGYGVQNHCKHPGPDNYTIALAQNEASHDLCGSGFGYNGELPARYRDCMCHTYNNGCEDEIEAIQEEIKRIENDISINPLVKAWLIAKYKRCIDNLMRTFIQIKLSEDEIEEAISFLSSQVDFKYRIMSYGIMNHNQEYDRSRIYLNNLQTSSVEQQDFVECQNIYLDYITDIDGFTLSVSDSLTLVSAGFGENTLASYARSIYYRLTGNKIEVYLPHLNDTITPRNSFVKIEKTMNEYNVLISPNPINQNFIQISCSEYDLDKYFAIRIFDLYGRQVINHTLLSGLEVLSFEYPPGMYLATLSVDGVYISSHKLIKQ